MKSAICTWVVATFLLLGGLTLPSFQLQSYAQIFAEDFAAFDRQNDSINSSGICRLRAGSQRLAMAPTRTVTAYENLFQFPFPDRSTPLPTPFCKQNLHSSNVVLRI
jgi:hypothetical protein